MRYNTKIWLYIVISHIIVAIPRVGIAQTQTVSQPLTLMDNNQQIRQIHQSEFRQQQFPIKNYKQNIQKDDHSNSQSMQLRTQVISELPNYKMTVSEVSPEGEEIKWDVVFNEFYPLRSGQITAIRRIRNNNIWNEPSGSRTIKDQKFEQWINSIEIPNNKHEIIIIGHYTKLRKINPTQEQILRNMKYGEKRAKMLWNIFKKRFPNANIIKVTASNFASEKPGLQVIIRAPSEKQINIIRQRQLTIESLGKVLQESIMPRLNENETHLKTLTKATESLEQTTAELTDKQETIASKLMRWSQMNLFGIIAAIGAIIIGWMITRKTGSDVATNNILTSEETRMSVISQMHATRQDIREDLNNQREQALVDLQEKFEQRQYLPAPLGNSTGDNIVDDQRSKNHYVCTIKFSDLEKSTKNIDNLPIPGIYHIDIFKLDDTGEWMSKMLRPNGKPIIRSSRDGAISETRRRFHDARSDESGNNARETIKHLLAENEIRRDDLQ